MAYLNALPIMRAQFPKALLGAVLMAATIVALPASAAAPPIEQVVKASYIFKFAPFVEWPAGSFSTAASPFVICLAGQDPFGLVIDEVVRGQRVAGRPIVVRRLGAAAPSGCQILFLGRPMAAGGDPLAPLAGQPVLTVTDAGSGMGGAIIQFVMQGGRVRFQIDDAGARANGLVISSKLLGLSLAAAKR